MQTLNKQAIMSVHTILMFVISLASASTFADQPATAIVDVATTYNVSDYIRPWQMRGQATRSGSGSIIEGRRVLTNAHVVSDATLIKLRRADTSEQYVATIAFVSHELDLAVLEVADSSFYEGSTPLVIGDMPSIGAQVQAYGFPKDGKTLAVTEGVVSRIERISYSHSGLATLASQIDAAINSGSSGGPVLFNGQIVGITFQVGVGENVGYMVPSPVINHFLDDIADGAYEGTPYLGFFWQDLRNAQHRNSLGLNDGQSGILVIEPKPGYEGENKLLAGDVLLEVDGNMVANDGTISWRNGQRISYTIAIELKQIGDVLPIRILRDGHILDRDILLTIPKQALNDPVPRRTYEKKPSYIIVGGLIFSPLTTNYLLQWGKRKDLPQLLRHENSISRRLRNQHRKQVITLIDVLPDVINQGYEGLEDSVVSRVNDIEINSMSDFVEAIQANKEAYHVITMSPFGAKIVFEREGLNHKNDEIIRKYGVPFDRSIDLRRPE